MAVPFDLHGTGANRDPEKVCVDCQLVAGVNMTVAWMLTARASHVKPSG
jgi:hypothetical protein